VTSGDTEGTWQGRDEAARNSDGRSVEGETLAKRLEKGPLPLEQVLKYGAQIADALDKAHRSGVVHRDLKPGNIMLTSTGGELLWISGNRASAAAPLPVSWRQRKREWLAWIAVGIGIVSGFAGGYFSRPAEPAYPIRSFLPAPENASFVFIGDAGGPPVLSPDGKSLAFVAAEAGGARRIYVRQLASVEARPLPGTDDLWAPFWSPDGRRLGFFANGKLRVIDVQGGTPVPVADAPNGRGGSWSRDGTIVFSPDFYSSLYRVSASGGAAVAVTRLDASKHTSHRWPWFLPDGKHFLYLAVNHQAPRGEPDGIYFASVDGKENIRLRAAFTNPQYGAGFLLHVREDELVAQAFEPSTGKLQGEEQQVANGVTEDISTWRAAFTVSTNGLLAYSGGALAQTQLAWYDRAGKQFGNLGERFRNLVYLGQQLRLSPAGDRAALAIQGSTADIWVLDVTRGALTRLTFGPLGISTPVWSPDGKWVAYRSENKNGVGYAIARRPAAGGPEETMFSDKDDIRPADWSADGRYLLYDKGTFGTHAEIWALPLVGDRKPFQLVPSGAYMSQFPRFSPDLRWVAYWSDESGRREVYVVPFHGGGKWLVSTNGGTNPTWRSDGKELFFLSLNGELTAVTIGLDGEQLKLGPPQALFRTVSSYYDVAPGGQKFLLGSVGDQGSKPITLVTNWTAELKK